MSGRLRCPLVQLRRLCIKFQMRSGTLVSQLGELALEINRLAVSVTPTTGWRHCRLGNRGRDRRLMTFMYVLDLRFKFKDSLVRYPEMCESGIELFAGFTNLPY